jgi:hypothetical protein
MVSVVATPRVVSVSDTKAGWGAGVGVGVGDGVGAGVEVGVLNAVVNVYEQLSKVAVSTPRP